MCRLFGLTAGTALVGAAFWLLDAPDSLEAQGRRNVDGSGRNSAIELAAHIPAARMGGAVEVRPVLEQ